MSNANRIALVVMRSPLLWGLLVSFGFFTVLHSGSLQALPQGAAWEAFLLRYCAGHEIEYVETAMFFVAAAALVLKALDVAAQRKTLAEPLLGPMPAAGQTANDCPALLARLAALPDTVQQCYLVRRFRDALKHIQTNGSTDALDEHLKYLTDVDGVRSHSSYAFVRIIIWAIPIMGFLGTVVGITIAIASLSPEALEESLPTVTAGLGVAFDTTALALVLSCALMFGQYFVDQRECKLLEGVDERTAEELNARFQRAATGGDPQVAAVRRIAESVLEAAENTVHRQADLWQATIDSAQQRWSENATATQDQIQAALSAALGKSMDAHARQIAASAQTTADQNLRQWAEVQKALDRSSEAVIQQQRELIKQGEVLRDVVQATGQVAKLEETLNRNLAALSGAQNFDQAVQSLAAVIHLLNARLNQPAAQQVFGRGETRTLGQAA